MKCTFWSAAVTVVVLGVLLFGTACEEVEGECRSVHDEGAGTGEGAGGGPPFPGAGGYGVSPEPQGTGDADVFPPGCITTGRPDHGADERPDVGADSCGAWPGKAGGSGLVQCGGPCKAQCLAGKVTVVTFQPADFKFITIVPDDKTGAAGGWQGATAVLPFYRWTALLPEAWTCTVRIEMAIRSAAYGFISTEAASFVTAGIANRAGRTVLNMVPDLPSGIFCLKFKQEMQELFKKEPLGSYYGARIK